VILNWIDHQFLFPIWYSRHTWNQWRKRKKEKKHTGCGIDIEEWRSCLFLLFLIVKIKDEMTEKGRAFLYVLKCRYTCASHRAVGEWYGWFYYYRLYGSLYASSSGQVIVIRTDYCRTGLGAKAKFFLLPYSILVVHISCTIVRLFPYNSVSIARPVCGGWQYHQQPAQGLAPLYV
jgi:hypothetical protein